MTKKILLLVVLSMIGSLLLAQERERTEHWNMRNELFDKELSSAPQGTVVFLGNSITEGFDLPTAYPGKDYVNRGIIGDHLDGVIQRLGNSAVGLKPQKIFLLIGINDIGDRRDDAYLKKMYTLLLDTLQQELPETQIYIHSLLPTSSRWKNCPPDQIKRINTWLALEALRRNLIYVNLHPHFLDGMNYVNMDLSNDGLHPNAEGYEVWKALILNYLE